MGGYLKFFRIINWIKYALILIVIGLVYNGHRDQINENMALTNVGSEAETISHRMLSVQKGYAQNLDQQTRIAQRQRQILDKYDDCTAKEQLLDPKTGDCE